MQTQREKEIELLVDYFISFCPGNSDVMDKYINEDHDINEKIDRLMQDKILVGEAEKIFAKTPQRKAIEERFKNILRLSVVFLVSPLKQKRLKTYML